MVNTKLIKLLKTFSKTEIYKFMDFVNSPFFNKNHNVIKLCEAVVEYHPGFDSEKFTEEEIFRKLFGKEKYNYFKIKNIISDLYQLSLKFIGITAYKKKGTRKDIDLLNELHDRKLEQAFLQLEKQINSALENTVIKDELFYSNQYQFARISTAHFKFKKTGYTFNLIQNEADTFFRYSLIGMLRHYSKMLTNSNHGNITFDMKMFEQVWDFVKDKNFNEDPSCMIYRQIIKIELYKEENDYKDLLNLKNKFINNLPDEDIYYILLIINSFAVYRLKLGDESYYKDRYLSFKEILDRKFVPEDNFLFVNFISTFTSACLAGETGWAEDFLSKHQKGISPPDEKSNAVNYCRAFLAYRLKKYDEALDYFSKTNFKLFLMKVMVKSYTLRIYYEQNMWEQVFSAIDAFRHYLKNENQISEDQKSTHYEFMKHLSELTKLKLENVRSKNNVNLSLLKKQITEMQSNSLGVKNWLTEKAENFI